MQDWRRLPPKERGPKPEEPHSFLLNGYTPERLLLRADLHTLMDCGLLAIDPATHNIILAPTVRDSPDYKKLHGQRLRDPVSASDAPRSESLGESTAEVGEVDRPP